jgi:rhodanese-related sulfurtransferase
VEVYHGEWVETGKKFFFEGTWNGKYEELNFHSSYSFMGSGGVVNPKGKLIICSPCHTTECVYGYKQKDELLFSNSIPFILEMVGDELDPYYLDYENDALSISDGIYKYINKLTTKKGYIDVYYYCNLEIEADLGIHKYEKPEPPHFKSYKDYYNFLYENLKGIAENAASNKRKTKYDPIVFCSNGYDSAACAALGREIGCKEAVVYESKKGYRSDSGIEIVKYLGYKNIFEKKENDYLNYNFAEEFISSGEIGTSIYFAASEKELKGKFLLSGIHGDKVWDIHTPYLGKDLIRSFYPDTAKTEFRLRVGFLNVILPFIGAQNVADINRISRSSEMLPWTLGNDYDRPIPRRILEEKGVPREAFGFSKEGGAGSSLRFANLQYLKKVMPSESFKEFNKYYKENKKYRRIRMKNIDRHITYFLYCVDIFLQQRGITILEKLLSISRWKRKYKCSPWAPSLLFNWAVSKLSKKYREGIDRAIPYVITSE